MSDLYPTKTRLQLLTDIHNGQVLTDITADDDVILLFPYAPTQWQDRRKVTARVRELEAAGWVEEHPHGVDWRVTDAGYLVLNEAFSGSRAAAVDALVVERFSPPRGGR